LTTVIRASLISVLGVVTTAGVLAACGSEPEDNGVFPPSGGGPGPSATSPGPATPGNGGSTGLPPGAGTADTNTPVVIAGNGGGPSTGGPIPTASPTSTPTTPVPPANPPYTPDVEPTNCVIPPVATTPIGYGRATTGGGNATPVVVNSFAQAEAALAAYSDAFEDGLQNALVLRYTGTFAFASITDVCTQHTLEPQVLQIKEMENVTFEGAPGSSANFGIKINRAKNVIVRNMTMGLLPGGGDSDAITIEGNDTNGDVENVWIDHNELFSSTKEDCAGAGDTEFDGLIDIKKGARRITISYNYLHDHQKTGLLGFSDSDETERYVTFHHNRYENVVSRTPLLRFGFVHIFNNYYGRITGSGINSRMGAIALIESNFFENAANPVTSRFTDVAGFWELRNNHVGPGITWTVEDDTLANADTWQNTATFPPNELDYTYTPDVAGCVKQIVLAQAGAKLR
jgi:pectate lyase